MGRATGIDIDVSALLHNLEQVSLRCQRSQIIAMVKANAYGSGLAKIIPALDGRVALFGVACMEEALVIQNLQAKTPILLAQGVFAAEEYLLANAAHLEVVLHQPHQLRWLLEQPLARPQKVWVKINTGMNRLGFEPAAVYEVLEALRHCSWVDQDIGLMTHFACADEPLHPSNNSQMVAFNRLIQSIHQPYKKSLANSAAILTIPDAHADFVRPGLMLYGVSPFKNQQGKGLGLKPVMRFYSMLSAIHHYPKGVFVGYGASWQTKAPSVIGVVAAGYADGYPRHLKSQTFVAIHGVYAPIVGHISMDMLTVDLSSCPDAAVGDQVELWGPEVPVEDVARAAETISYELLCHFSGRGIMRL